MEKSEPALVPQWLRSASGGSSSANHPGVSSSHSDSSIVGHSNKDRTFRNNSSFDSSRSAFLDRSYSTNSRRGSSSNGFAKNPYSSFSRGHRDRDREKEKEMKGFADRWDFDSDHLGNNLFARLEKDKLRRSNSVILKKQGELPVQKGVGELKSGGSNNKYSGNGFLSGTTVGNRIKRSVFDKDFPVLGSEEKQAAPDLGRVSSPVLGTSVQILPVGSSALIGGEGWSSALAEVPKIIGTSSMNSSSVQSNTNAGARSGPPTATTGLNMAEALVQPPERVGTPPESSVTAQKLEELAIKQSRQLIPVTPSMPKISAMSSDKLKPKIAAARTGDLNIAAKNCQQQSLSHPSNQSIGSGHVKSDAPKKFLVLKPARENGVLSSPKDVSSTSSSTGNRVVNSQSSIAPVATSASSRSPRDPKLSIVGNKAIPLASNAGTVVERRPSSSQAKSRNDFFNLMRKKSLMTTDPAVQDSPHTNAPQVTETSGEAKKEIVGASESDQVADDAGKTTSNSDTSGASQTSSQPEEKVAMPPVEAYPNEEEAAFLRSLGWDENSGDDEGLTEEEINAFYKKYMKLKPSLKLCQDMQMKLTMVSESLGETSS